ncbi:Carrier protein, mitochondrial [Taxawa tesnikishii (nom. ined.)]|nr:Carrier protein, mitochondrial [Dothideales sp. JES 119]
MAGYMREKDSRELPTFSGEGQRHDRIVMDDNTTRTAPANSMAAPEMETSISQKMLAAVTGSILTSLLITPLDVVRVRLQSQSSPSPSQPSNSNTHPFVRLPPNLGVSACCKEMYWVQNQSQFCVASAPTAAAVDEMLMAECAAEETERRAINSTLDGLRKIARNEGVTTLWRGLSPTLAMSIPANVIYFAGYDWLRTSKKSPINGMISDAYAPLVAGSVARMLAAFAVSPIEMLRTRMQASQSASPTGVMKETISGMREMVAEEGPRSLWRGLTLTLWRDVPFSAFYWWGYEYGREKLHNMREEARGRDPVSRGSSRGRSRSRSDLDHKTVLIDSFIAGAASGIKGVFTHPRRGSGIPPEARAMPRFLWHIFKTEGAAGLFKGWAARCLKVAPACAIMISSYEIGKKMAHTVNERKELVVAEN